LIYCDLTLKFAWIFFLLKECVLIQNGLVLSANSWPKTVTADIKQKFIHWATRGRLNNHCNSKHFVGMKRQRMATGFLNTSGIQAQSAIFN